MEKREKIEKIAENEEDKMLLAKVYDKITAGQRRNFPANTCFLSLREQAMATRLLGEGEELLYFGGYEEAERKILCYLPSYLEAESLYEADSPVVCLKAEFYEKDTASHRDFLGALMGAGIARETVGDICVGQGNAYLFLTAEIAPYVQQNLLSAGRAKLRLTRIPLREAKIAPPETREQKDTLASLRLDSVVSSGFRMSRGAAAQAISAGKAAVDGLPCEKPDKPVSQGAVISLRGMGKIRLKTVGGETKKGRIAVVIEKFI